MKTERCPHCDAKIVRYKHGLNEPLVGALVKLANAGGEANISKIGLTHNQICNFQKLRYWDLVRKCDVDGCWHVSTKGYSFLSGSISIKKQAITFRGKTVAFDGKDIFITSYLPTAWMKREEYILNAE